MKKKSLDAIVLEEIIRATLTEQLNPKMYPTSNKTYTSPYSPYNKEKMDKALARSKDPQVMARNQIAMQLANQIYKSKGVLWDNEFEAVKAVLLIPDRATFDAVQWHLQQLTGGQGLGQYLSSFMVVNNDRKISSKEFTAKALGVKREKYPLTKKYLDRIIVHLFQIDAPSQTIQILMDFRDNFEREEGDTVHMALNIAGFVAAFIPVYGWAVSAGIFALDSAKEYNRGNVRESGLSAIFAAIPFIGRLKAVQALGEAGMAALGYKLATSSNPILTNLERVAIRDIWKQRYFVKHGLDNYMKASLYNQLRNGVIRDRIRAKYGTKAMNVLFKIADGSLKLTGNAAKLAVAWEAYGSGIETYNKLFDKYYTYAKSQGIKMPDDQERINKMFDVERLPKSQPADATYVQKK